MYTPLYDCGIIAKIFYPQLKDRAPAFCTSGAAYLFRTPWRGSLFFRGISGERSQYQQAAAVLQDGDLLRHLDDIPVVGDQSKTFDQQEVGVVLLEKL